MHPCCPNCRQMHLWGLDASHKLPVGASMGFVETLPDTSCQCICGFCCQQKLLAVVYEIIEQCLDSRYHCNAMIKSYYVVMQTVAYLQLFPVQKYTMLQETSTNILLETSTNDL